MPTYRDPATGRIFFRASPFSEPTLLGSPGGGWRMRSHGHRPHRSSTSASHGHGVTQQATQGPSTPQAPHMELSEFLPAAESSVASHPSSSRARPRRRVPRRARPGGKITALAFYTLGDKAMENVWEHYAHGFVGQRGPVLGATSQQEAAKQLNALRDTNIKEVFFIGHGFDDSVKNLGPAFMLSGVSRRDPNTGHLGFTTQGHRERLLQGEEGPLLRALASHLSIEGQVVLGFLSCHTGKDKIFQHAVATVLSQLEPALDVKVFGYRDYYCVARDLTRNAHIAKDVPESQRRFEIALSNSHADPNETETERLIRLDKALFVRCGPDYRAPDHPMTDLVVEIKNGADIEPTTPDLLGDLEIYGDDPLGGLDS